MAIEYSWTAEELKQERDHAMQQLHDLESSQQVLSSFYLHKGIWNGFMEFCIDSEKFSTLTLHFILKFKAEKQPSPEAKKPSGLDPNEQRRLVTEQVQNIVQYEVAKHFFIKALS